MGTVFTVFVGVAVTGRNAAACCTPNLAPLQNNCAEQPRVGIDWSNAVRILTGEQHENTTYW